MVGPLVSHGVAIELLLLFALIDRLLTEENVSHAIRPDPHYASVSDVSAALKRWHAARYGDAVNVARTHAKVNEEKAELDEALLAYVAADSEHNACGAAVAAAHVAEEAADVCIVLWHLVRGLGFDLGQALLAKINVIFDRLKDKEARLGRDWGMPPEATLASLEGK